MVQRPGRQLHPRRNHPRGSDPRQPSRAPQHELVPGLPGPRPPTRHPPTAVRARDGSGRPDGADGADSRTASQPGGKSRVVEAPRGAGRRRYRPGPGGHVLKRRIRQHLASGTTATIRRNRSTTHVFEALATDPLPSWHTQFSCISQPDFRAYTHDTHTTRLAYDTTFSPRHSLLALSHGIRKGRADTHPHVSFWTRSLN